MEINILEQIKETAQAFGVNCAFLNKDSDWEYEWDSRIYKSLGVRVIFDENLENALHMCTPGTMYVVRDSYETVMVVFLYQESIVAIGPFVTANTEELLPVVTENNRIPEDKLPELREIYNTYALIINLSVLEDLIVMNMKYLFPGVTISKQHLENVRYSTSMFEEIRIMDENRMSMEAVEARYRVEDEFMNAVASGDYERVLEVNKKFLAYRMSPRTNDEIREMKNRLVILNTLLRRAVLSAQVHPAHIDRLSGDFARKIEVAAKAQEIVSIARDMPRKYCLLVTNYSLEGYTELMRNIINYIDFNLTEDLSLNAIATRFSVNASHLSKQFKKEIGKTLTDYVNEKRIVTSLKYLATTEYSVQSVAELVGIYDENYYSRLFRKVQGTTPSQYRKLIKRR